MGGMSMPGPSHGSGMMAMPGGMSALPNWLAIVWTVVFMAILLSHLHHLLGTSGQHRAWHCVHVAMAAGMAFMYAPASLHPPAISASFWEVLFEGGCALTLLWIATTAISGRPVNILWALSAVDLAAMAYMWRPAGIAPSVGWVLVVYFTAQAMLWVSGVYRRIDERASLRRVRFLLPVPGAGVAVVASPTAEPLIARIRLRASMTAMALGMAYMLAAMLL